MIVGLVATGVEKNFAAAARDYLEAHHVFEPDAGQRARYREGFGKFMAVRGGGLPIWQHLAGGTC